MSDKANIHILSTRLLPDGGTAYRLLVDGKYYAASEWEHELITKGFSPEELGMFEFRKEEDID